MNNSRLNRTYTLQEFSSNMDTSEVTKSKSEDNKETVHYSLDSDVCKSQVTSCSQTQINHFYKSENESEEFAPPNKIIKTVQRLTPAESEILKQPNDNGTYDSRVYGGTDDSQDDDGTHDSKDEGGIDDSHDDNGTDDSQDDDGSNDGRADICNTKDEADLFYGTHETLVSEGGEEADLHKHYVGCKKNPGHTKFVPVNDFNISHLPEGPHDNDLVELIKAAADQTVRVNVKMTSPKRPEFWPNTTVPYAFYNRRGSDVTRVGTGMLGYVNKWTEEVIKKDDMGTCPCHKCQQPENTPSKVWGYVMMYTATHVVFDDLEARHTTCRLFFDRQDSPLVTLDGWMVVRADIERDRCELKCVTCDVDLLDKLHKMWRHRLDLLEKVFNKYKSSRDEFKLIFIVSHPHGCPKQISVGQWIDRKVVADDYVSSTKYTYTTSTCPGSSGAYVHPLRHYTHHVHSGVNSKGNNYCGVGYELR